jgi:cytidyltransferase-like protein
MTNKTVAIFGVFDGIHEGHLSFIREAKKEGNHLVAIIARDSIVEELKGKLPLHSEAERVNELLKVPDIDLVVLGDVKIGTYNILKEVNPSVVFLGYDQKELYKNMSEVMKNGNLPKMEIICGKPHKPEIFHSSILNNKN